MESREQVIAQPLALGGQAEHVREAAKEEIAIGLQAERSGDVPVQDNGRTATLSVAQAKTDGTKRYNSHAIGRPGLGPAGVDPPRAFLRGGQVEIPTLHQPLALEPL